MKEIRDIVASYHAAAAAGKNAALATVVQVEGSSYRRAGARMLVTDDGQLTGAISGGCLEGDARKKALLAISQGVNKLVTYDTTDEDDLKFGVQLGCNGIVHILFEPITVGERNPIALLEQLLAKRTNAVLATLFSLHHGQQTGTTVLYQEGFQTSLSPSLPDQLQSDIRQAYATGQSVFQSYENDRAKEQAFLQFVEPAVSLVIVGAGNDAQPLAQMAAILGWHTTVVDGRQTHPTKARFPSADRTICVKAEDAVNSIGCDSRTVFVLMTHNYNYDLVVLANALKSPTPYVGVLGPKKKLERMLEELAAGGMEPSGNEGYKIYGPVGLDIGAETAEEIALSIVAEIKAVLSQASGQSLRQKKAPIHAKGNE